MSIDNILGNLIAAGIWAVLAYCTYFFYKKLQKISQTRKELIESAKRLASTDSSYELRFNLVIYLQIQKDKISRLAYIVTLYLVLEMICMILYGMIISSETILASIYAKDIKSSTNISLIVIDGISILAIFTAFVLWRYIVLLNGFEDAILEGLRARIYYLESTPGTEGVV